jgi:hypothetical protein
MDEPVTEVEALLAQARTLRQEAHELVPAIQEAARAGNLEQYIPLKIRRADLEQQAQTIEEQVIVSQALQHQQDYWGRTP